MNNWCYVKVLFTDCPHEKRERVVMANLSRNMNCERLAHREKGA
jgi:hypothetical protein